MLAICISELIIYNISCASIIISIVRYELWIMKENPVTCRQFLLLCNIIGDRGIRRIISLRRNLILRFLIYVRNQSCN